MARLKIQSSGSSTRYECEDMDAGLPLHSHKPGSKFEHDVHCIAGLLVVFNKNGWARVLSAGERLEFDSTDWHGLAPAAPGTVFVNTSYGDVGHDDTVVESSHNAPDAVLQLIKRLS